MKVHQIVLKLAHVFDKDDGDIVLWLKAEDDIKVEAIDALSQHEIDIKPNMPGIDVIVTKNKTSGGSTV